MQKNKALVEDSVATAPLDRTASPTAENDARAEFLLDVAAQSFLEKGYEATSVGAIARRAHASKETFYTKFNSKSELFRAVMRRLMDRFVSDLGSVLASDRGPDKALTAFGTLMLERMVSDEGVGMQNIIFMEARRFPEVADIFYELGPRRTVDALTAYFESQVKKGTLRKMDTGVAATHFMALLTTDMMMLRSLGYLGKPTSEEKSRRIHSAVDVFLRAYS